MKNNLLPRWGVLKVMIYCWEHYPYFFIELHRTKKEARRSKADDSSIYDYQIVFDTLDVDGLHVAMGKALKKLEKINYEC